MADKNQKDTRDDLLINAVARGCSHDRAAQESGYSPRTVRRRLADSKFRREVEDARRRMVGRVAGSLCASGLAAVKTLVELLGTKSPNVRLAAARAIIDNLPVKFSLRKMEDLPVDRTIELILPDFSEEWSKALDAGLLQKARTEEELQEIEARALAQREKKHPPPENGSASPLTQNLELEKERGRP